MGDDDRTVAEGGGTESAAGGTPTIRRVTVDDGAGVATDDRYVERGLIGVGGMGEVHELLDRSLGRVVARKRMAEDQSAARFLREVRIQAQLEHPAIVPVYTLDRRDGGPTFTMKRVQGRTLQDVLPGASDDERFSLRRLVEAVAKVALAVDYAHSRGVVHRDLKPANIMLGHWGEVYVLDWGVARVTHQDSEEALLIEMDRGDHTVPVGTPGFMAPEMVRGDDAGSVQSDVYALGCILFQVVTGKPLHVGNLEARLASTLAGVDIASRVEALQLSPELVAICQLATAQADERHATARAFHDALQRYLDGDRDLVLRQDMADRLVARSAASIERATHGDRAERRYALRSLAAALALLPDHDAALRGLMRLLTERPREIPAEVRRRLQKSDDERAAALAGPAASSGVALLIGIGLFAWMGVRSWPLVGLLLACCIFALSTVLLDGRRARLRAAAPHQPLRARRDDLLPTFASCLTTGVLALFTTPWLAVPAVAVSIILLRVLRDDRQAWLVALMSGSSVLGPLSLEALGVLPPTLTFHDGVATLHPLAVAFQSLPTQIFLVGGIVMSIPVSTAIALAFRKTLKRAELEVELHAWQLRQTLPDTDAKPR